MAKRKKAKAATKSSKAAKSASTPAKAKRPDGSISAGIYDAVEKLVASGKMTRAAAFRQIAKETGRKEGTVSVNYYYVAKKRGTTKKSPSKVAKTSAAKASKTGTQKPGTNAKGVAAMIYDAVEKLVAGGKMTRAAAFRQVAKQSGRREGTVSVNYYYAAKKRGMKPGGTGRPKGIGGARRNGSPSNIESVFRSLTELIRAQESELTALRRENVRFAELRRLFAGR